MEVGAGMSRKVVTAVVAGAVVLVLAGLFVRGFTHGRQFADGTPEAALKEWFGSQTINQPAKACNYMTQDSQAKYKQFAGASDPTAGQDCHSAVTYSVANPGNSPVLGVIHAAANGTWSMPDDGVVKVSEDGKSAEVLPTAFIVPGTDATVMAGRITMVKGSTDWLVQVVKIRS